jgi:hypothetical protein
MNRVTPTNHKRLLNQSGKNNNKVVEKKAGEKVLKKNDNVTNKKSEISIKKIQEKNPNYNQFTVLG